MPFFCAANKMKNHSVTLQVRIHEIKKSIARKRASLSASASLTVEAALVLPLFLFGGVILMMPFRVLDVHRQVQAVGEHVSEEIGQAAYLSKYTDEDSFWNTAAAHAYAEAAVRTRLEDLPVHQLSLLRSSLLQDGETVDLVMDYEIRLPFSVFGLNSVKQTKEKDVVVYVGKNSSRYHLSRTCHYLHNDLTAVAFEEVEYRRNEGGSRYGPCARCGGAAGAMVYIMPSGRHYRPALLLALM